MALERKVANGKSLFKNKSGLLNPLSSLEFGL